MAISVSAHRQLARCRHFTRRVVWHSVCVLQAHYAAGVDCVSRRPPLCGGDGHREQKIGLGGTEKHHIAPLTTIKPTSTPAEDSRSSTIPPPYTRQYMNPHTYTYTRLNKQSRTGTPVPTPTECSITTLHTRAICKRYGYCPYPYPAFPQLWVYCPYTVPVYIIKGGHGSAHR